MKTTTFPALALALFTLACGATDPEKQPPTSTGQFALCGSSNKCPAGQFCFNGLCAPGCQSNQNCASDQYCDTQEGPPFFCKNKSVPSCPATACASNQECRDGLCSALPEAGPTSCTPRADFNDSCDKYAVCFDEDDDGPTAAACVSFPPCPEDGICPVGTAGAACNEKYLPSKGRFCMPGVCAKASHCPSEWKCVKQTQNQVLGFCSAGGPNAPCFQGADCLSSSCMTAAPGFMGFCQ